MEQSTQKDPLFWKFGNMQPFFKNYHGIIYLLSNFTWSQVLRASNLLGYLNVDAIHMLTLHSFILCSSYLRFCGCIPWMCQSLFVYLLVLYFYSRKWLFCVNCISTIFQFSVVACRWRALLHKEGQVVVYGQQLPGRQAGRHCHRVIHSCSRCHFGTPTTGAAIVF